MKSYVKTFNYQNAKGEIKTHKVFIMTESTDHIQGFDLDKLTPSEVRGLKKNWKNHEIKDDFYTKANPSATHVAGSSKLMRAWRSYKLIGISDDILTKADLVAKITEETGRNARNVRANINAVLRGKGRKTAYGHKISRLDVNQFTID